MPSNVTASVNPAVRCALTCTATTRRYSDTLFASANMVQHSLGDDVDILRCVLACIHAFYFLSIKFLKCHSRASIIENRFKLVSVLQALGDIQKRSSEVTDQSMSLYHVDKIYCVSRQCTINLLNIGVNMHSDVMQRRSIRLSSLPLHVNCDHHNTFIQVIFQCKSGQTHLW
jgi:hypothetical protein